MNRFSSRKTRLDKSFLAERLRGAVGYDRIAGYFNSSLLELVGEELESVTGKIRVIANADLDPRDVQTAKAAQEAVKIAWTSAQPEHLLEQEGAPLAQARFKRLFELLRSEKLEVRVIPDAAFGLIHGKAGVITYADGRRTSFLGSTNESRSGWRVNYELLWEDSSAEAVAWVQEEFEALWSSNAAVQLAEAVIEDIGRLSHRHVLHQIEEWKTGEPAVTPDPAPAVIEAPVYRTGVGLWAHQKFFVKTVFDAHCGPVGKARFVLADQVGLGKTLQLAMAAQLIALVGEKPVLVICPKTLTGQWQGELLELLGMPSAVWDGAQWVDERGVEHPVAGAAGIRKCPRRVGIVSSSLISRGSDAARQLLGLEYECVIVDEAHRARRRNLGPKRDNEKPDPNKLLAFLHELAPRTRSLLLATATPVQLRPVEAWDLLDVLARGDDSVLGNEHSLWRKRVVDGLEMVMGRAPTPTDEAGQWEWERNPLPPRAESRHFSILRSRLGLSDAQAVAPGSLLEALSGPDRARLRREFGDFVRNHNPFIHRIIRRTRTQLEAQLDPETNEPLLQPIAVKLLGEGDSDAIVLPPYLREAYELAEEFCHLLAGRVKGAGFLKTLLLRRVGSSMQAGRVTAERMLDGWASIEVNNPEDDDELELGDEPERTLSDATRTLTGEERGLLERFVEALEANKERDPKAAVVLRQLRDQGWLDEGCIVFSQYRDSIQWLAEHLTEVFPDEPIALYSGPTTSGIVLGGAWAFKTREDLKQMVRRGEIRLLLGTDAASEGLNLQRLGRLINLDLPWNPTRLEQRKGRIQRIGQVRDTVEVYNLRYKDSVEDRVHQLLSSRLANIFNLFGQIPDVLEDVWIAVALGDRARAKKVIDEVPRSHPFEARYSRVDAVDWESCRAVLDERAKRMVLERGW